MILDPDFVYWTTYKVVYFILRKHLKIQFIQILIIVINLYFFILNHGFFII